MKKIYELALGLFFLIVVSQTHGQTEITYANHAPFIGYSSTHMTMESFFDPLEIDPGPEGPGQTWDFSTYEATEEFELLFINPANTPFADDVAGTDINLAVESVEEEGGAGYSFMHVSTSELALRAFGIMEEGEPLYFSIFNPSPVIFEYPFAYGDSFETEGEMQYTTDGFTTIQKMYATSEADAWGTIITPLATYNNVLRIKTTSIDSMFIFVDEMPVYEDGFVTYEYLWYSQDHRMMVYEIVGDYEDEFLPYSLSYLLSETVNVDEMKRLSFNVYPNPTSGMITIEYPVVEERLSFRLVDLNGRLIAETAAFAKPGRLQLDVSAIPNGMYVLQMISDNQLIESQKIVVH